jgi:hypothetical protein
LKLSQIRKNIRLTKAFPESTIFYKVIQSGENMKLVRSAPLTVIAFSLGLAILAGAFNAEAQFKRNMAFVRAVEGSASYSDGSRSGSVTRGLFLSEGARVVTRGGSYVDLFLGENGPFVRITENSNMTLDRLQFREASDEIVIETSLNLREGRILGQVKKTSPASRYEVVTPTMVAGIRGTDYDISADGTTKVYDGQVVVAYSVDGQVPTFLVNAGFKFDPNLQQVVPLDTTVDGIFPDFPGLTVDELNEIRGNNRFEDAGKPIVGPRGPTVRSAMDLARDLGTDQGTSFISPIQPGVESSSSDYQEPPAGIPSEL